MAGAARPCKQHPTTAGLGSLRGRVIGQETSLAGHQATRTLPQLSTDPCVTHPGLSLPTCNMMGLEQNKGVELCFSGRTLSANQDIRQTKGSWGCG